MYTLDDIRGITAWDITSVLGAFLACVAPGFLIIFLFNPALVHELDTLKLVVLSAAFTLPLVAINAFAFAVIGPIVGAVRGPDRKHIFFWLATWTFMALYTALLLAFLGELTPRVFLGVACLVDAALGVLVFLVMRFLTTPTA